MRYRIEFERRVLQQIKKLPPQICRKVMEKNGLYKRILVDILCFQQLFQNLGKQSLELQEENIG